MSRPESEAPFEHRPSAARCAARTPTGGPVARMSSSYQPHVNSLQLSTPWVLNQSCSHPCLSTRR
eukprot:13917259-Heterocapsa_arctica.AAC.1